MMNPAAHVIQILKPYKVECSTSPANAADGRGAEIIDLKAGDALIVEVHGDFENPTLIEESTGKIFHLPDASYFEYVTP